jgi:hypothetical protein
MLPAAQPGAARECHFSQQARSFPCNLGLSIGERIMPGPDGRIIIGIHGLRPKPPADVEERYWRGAICEGLARNCDTHVAPGALPFALCYWADWRGDPPKDPTTDDEPWEAIQGSGPLPEYHETWRDRIRTELGDETGDVIDWFKAHGAPGLLGAAALERHAQDLHIYYTDDGRRGLLRRHLRDLLIDHAGKRICLIAHSMGSIVAYDVLRLIGDERPDFTIEHLVTIGSPLGLPYVRRKIIQEHRAARTPSVVRRWTNLADRWDRIAPTWC